MAEFRRKRLRQGAGLLVVLEEQNRKEPGYFDRDSQAQELMRQWREGGERKKVLGEQTLEERRVIEQLEPRSRETNPRFGPPNAVGFDFHLFGAAPAVLEALPPAGIKLARATKRGFVFARSYFSARFQTGTSVLSRSIKVAISASAACRCREAMRMNSDASPTGTKSSR